MLENNDRVKIEKYIDKIFLSIKSDIKRNIGSGISGKQAIDNVINITVNKFTPESKMILSSTYNMLMEKTFTKSLYANPQNKAAFYSRDILKDLNAKFVFDVPAHIDYEECRNFFNAWTLMGVISDIGGVVVISLNSTRKMLPLGIAMIIAGIGIIAYEMWKDHANRGSQNINNLIHEYLKNVKLSLLSWVDEIANYYDSEVIKLEKEING